jgi:hypothetical protein
MLQHFLVPASFWLSFGMGCSGGALLIAYDWLMLAASPSPMACIGSDLCKARDTLNATLLI